MIHYLTGFWKFKPRFGLSLIPSWYTDQYTQEDRLKSIAEILGRQTAWNELLLEKINELTDEVNALKGE